MVGLLCSPSVVAQSFAPRHFNFHSTSALQDMNTVATPTIHTIGASSVQSSSPRYGSTQVISTNVFSSRARVERRAAQFGVGAWQGNVMKVQGGLAVENAEQAASVTMHRAIGGGNKPGNPVYVPLGDVPVWLVMLLAIGYGAVCYIKRKRIDNV